VTIEVVKQGVDDVEIGAQTGVEMTQITPPDFRFQLVENFIQQ
jgi:hypothetical protein